MKIDLGDFDDPRVIELLRFHLEGMHANSPAGHVYALMIPALQTPDITFWTAFEGEDICGCGALKELSPTHGEIKSMRTAPGFLRRGVGQAILTHIIQTARDRGYRLLSLETGSGTAFEAALALYRKNGFQMGDKFGDYQKSEFNQFLHLSLV